MLTLARLYDTVIIKADKSKIMPNYNGNPLDPSNMPLAGRDDDKIGDKIEPVRNPDNGEATLDELVREGLIPPVSDGKSAEDENAEKYVRRDDSGNLIPWQPDILKPRHREVLRRVIEGATYVEIAADMGIHKQTVMLIATSPLFKAELSKLEDRLDHNIVQRADSMANEALDKLKILMRSARSEFIRKACAERILDTAGYSKVERKIVGIVTGEDVIRHLNKQRRDAFNNANVDNSNSDGNGS